jgi:hypothetical protein
MIEIPEESDILTRVHKYLLSMKQLLGSEENFAATSRVLIYNFAQTLQCSSNYVAHDKVLLADVIAKCSDIETFAAKMVFSLENDNEKVLLTRSTGIAVKELVSLSQMQTQPSADVFSVKNVDRAITQIDSMIESGFLQQLPAPLSQFLLSMCKQSMELKIPRKQNRDWVDLYRQISNSMKECLSMLDTLLLTSSWKDANVPQLIKSVKQFFQMALSVTQMLVSLDVLENEKLGLNGPNIGIQASSKFLSLANSLLYDILVAIQDEFIQPNLLEKKESNQEENGAIEDKTPISTGSLESKKNSFILRSQSSDDPLSSSPVINEEEKTRNKITSTALANGFEVSYLPCRSVF